MPCLLGIGFLGSAPMTDDASAGKRKPGLSGRNYQLEMRRRGPRIPLPIGPSYLYYDYPYYYARGHYPTHIGGYVYYPSYYRSRSYMRDRGSARRPGARRNSWR
jgi:hypothetical protein